MWHKSHVFSAKKCLAAAASAVACVAMIGSTAVSASALVIVQNHSVAKLILIGKLRISRLQATFQVQFVMCVQSIMTMALPL